MRDASINIVIAGEAGQGLVTIGEVLALALVRNGYPIVVTQDYQSRVRGGHNAFALRVGAEAMAPEESIDVLVALNQESVSLHRAALSPCGVVAGSDAFTLPPGTSLALPLAELGPGKYENMACLGAVAALLGLPRDALRATVRDRFGHKPGEADKNEEVLIKAWTWARGKAAGCLPPLPPPSSEGERLMLDGNAALALGALSAGLKFYSFYPMTPSTSIALTLVKHLEAGIIVEQAEDEIAAINLAIGASFAGAPAMVGTSGGGFALMVEAVSLAGMTETPLVIVVGQRPGPSTGLPTRTEQGELEFVLHAGHGEFPRAIYAPGSAEACFHAARRAMLLAEASQGPVFILTDQFLADSYRSVAAADVSAREAVVAGADPSRVSVPYRRYELTPGGVSPRLLPGRSEHLVVADSDEHTEDGHLTEDLAVRVRMVDKRRSKMEAIMREVLAPEWIGPEYADLVLVTWGSTRGAATEAARELTRSGQSAAVLHFDQVWPLAPERWLDGLKRARRAVAVEGNAQGQLARLIRRETGFEVAGAVHRYDGLPFTAEYILRGLAGQGG
jgi:2-oxoglutarate/2-oxoacid ferredoxin oxidoreductase subunit alpha